MEEDELLKMVETAQTIASSNMFKVNMTIPSDTSSPAKKIDYSIMAQESSIN